MVMRFLVPLRYAWAAPASLLGFVAAAAALSTGGRVQVVRGVLEVHGGVVSWYLRGRLPFVGCCAAMTLGHVILGRDENCLICSRDHEHVHVRQYERWGPFMIPAYFAAGFWQWWQGRHPYLDNPFEREAYADG
ncbi:MAG: hypothetical protein ACT4QC_04895 [Planctomycetaceae bacterium]